MEANVLGLYAFARAIDAQMLFRIKLTSYLITKSAHLYADYDQCLEGSMRLGWVIYCFTAVASTSRAWAVVTACQLLSCLLRAIHRKHTVMTYLDITYFYQWCT